MSDIWWSLPGPTSALARIEHALQDGRSSIIAVPECSGPSPCEQIVRSVYPNEWIELSQEDLKDRSPPEFLVGKFCTDVPATVVPDERVDFVGKSIIKAISPSNKSSLCKLTSFLVVIQKFHF